MNEPKLIAYAIGKNSLRRTFRTWLTAVISAHLIGSVLLIAYALLTFGTRKKPALVMFIYVYEFPLSLALQYLHKHSGLTTLEVYGLCILINAIAWGCSIAGALALFRALGRVNCDR